MKRINYSRIIDYVFILVQVIVIISLIFERRFNFIIDTSISVVVYVLCVFLGKRYSIRMSNFVKILIVITLLGHTVGGEFFKLYISSSIYDKLLHVFGTYSFTLFLYSAFLQVTKEPLKSGLAKVAFPIFIGISIGSLFETAEYLTDIILHPAIPTQHGLADTNLDLISDLAGSIAASLHLYLKE